MFTSLQAGRALAAIAVLLSHMTVLLALEKYGGNQFLDGWLKAGTFGVDYFFVLSGFIIYTAHKRQLGQPENLRPYLLKRFSRVFPIYWFYTAGFAGLVLVGFGDKAFNTGFGDWLSYATLIHWTDAEAPLSVAWTLFFEVQFYLLFAVAILSKRAAIAGLAIWFVAIIFFGSAEYGDAKGSFFIDLISWYNLNFLLGILAAFAVAKLSDGLALASLVTGTLGVIVFLISWHAGVYEAYPSVRLVGAIGFALLVYGGVALERRKGWAAPRPLVFLGDASYTIYLAHLPLASLYMIAANRLNFIDRIGVAATFTVGCVCVLAVCALLYLYVEKPFIGWSRKWTAKRPAPNASATVSSAQNPV